MKRSFGKFVTRLQDIGLYDKVEKIALKHYVSMRSVYEGGGGSGRAPSIGAARRAIYSWLMKEGKNCNEIARLFDRAPSGVTKLMRGKP